MSESDMRTKVNKALKDYHAIAVENPALPGTPDISYIGGWIECKWLPTWPVRAATTVHIDHYTKEQKLWARLHRHYGGQCHLLLQVRKDWLLFDGVDSARFIPGMNRQQLIDLASDTGMYSPRGLIREELIECVLRPLRNYSLLEDAGGDRSQNRRLPLG